MALLENGALRADPYLRLSEEDALPDGAPALLTLERLLREAPLRDAPTGVELPPDADPASLAQLLDRLALVALRLPKHKDGRAFTQARALRERLGFRGEIRATGHVLPDQYLFLLRCGVTTVEVPEDADLAVWDAARRLIPVAYQASVGAEAPLSLLRRRLGVA
ncbi:MAG TPA: DUF934 domain-containing protein [Falsiroseomonas sp.]|jgi:uncharacterized protein (DUF934 family)|nr:DUF934 domain-containing protein [Falsiroseomonas sp.]